MRRSVASGLGCLVATGLCYVAAIGLYMLATGVFGWEDREGGWGMGIAFTIGPLLALAIGIATAVLISRRSPR